MLALLLAILSASPSPAPPPLKTIITVKSSPLCGAFAAHANAAIASAVENDQALGTTILGLRSSDLTGSSIRRNLEFQRLANLADGIYRQYRSGEREVAALRDLARKIGDTPEGTQLKASADALGGALYRQHLIQRDLDGFIAYMQTSDMRSDWDPSESNAQRSVAQPEDPFTPAQNEGPGAYWLPPGSVPPAPALMVGHESRADDLQMADAASSDFQNRLTAIVQDEMNAGGHIELASDHC